MNPISLYAKEKVIIEKKLLEHENSISFRLATVFGMSPRMRLDLLVNDFTYRAFHDNFLVLFESSFKRNYIHVRDVTNVFLHGIKNFESMKNEIYNVGLSNANVSKKELCQIIKKKIQTLFFLKLKLVLISIREIIWYPMKKLKKQILKPKYSLDDGINQLIKGFKMIQNNIFKKYLIKSLHDKKIKLNLSHFICLNFILFLKTINGGVKVSQNGQMLFKLNLCLKHYQPNVPKHLGFYDLRLEESRIAQAKLAQKNDVFGFCYWHYWLGGGKNIRKAY